MSGLVHHEPAWLISKADQRLAKLADSVEQALLQGVDVVQTPLTEPPNESKRAYLRWDNSCDNCGRYLPTTLDCRVVERSLLGVPVVITVGACQRCWAVA